MSNIKPVYLEDWDTLKQVENDFELKDNELEDIEILLAYYSYEDYQGEAFVLFRRDGKLYEVNGSHCSCYGLEDQWSPEEVMLEELEHRITEGTFGLGYSYYDDAPNHFNIELKEIIQQLKENN